MAFLKESMKDLRTVECHLTMECSNWGAEPFAGLLDQDYIEVKK